MLRIQNMTLPLNYNNETIKRKVARELKITEDDILKISLWKRSLDARKKQDIHYVATVDIVVAREQEILKKCRSKKVVQAENKTYCLPTVPEKKIKERPVIIGCGPAGLFCGLILARCGCRPILLERGEDVDARTKTVENFWKTGCLNTSSNVQFGEGGAGTFSDGKLNTLVKDLAGRNRFVLETFVGAGAGEDILFVNKPHIGTDVLSRVVKNIRQEICSLGGEVRFLSKVTDIEIKHHQVQAVTVNDSLRLPCSHLVLAIGHSARDTFEMLAEKSVEMSAKAFAVGIRMEHPQDLINKAQYGCEDHGLPAADYKLTHKLKGGRGIYSFCMCPGGYVVNASSEERGLAVNGMSYHARDGRNANSALIVTVTPEDFGEGVLGGVEFQRRLEQAAWKAGNGKIPVQLFGDFREGKKSTCLGAVTPCIKGEWDFANLREVFPKFIGDSLEEGILAFEKTIPGFAREDGVLSGVESRTSSPVRIWRNERFLSNIQGLYPCGEGAGYAGGIMSAAMDGMKTAEALLDIIKF